MHVLVDSLQMVSSVKWTRPVDSEVGLEGSGLAEIRSRRPRSSRHLLSTLYGRRIRSAGGKYDTRDFEVCTLLSALSSYLHMSAVVGND